MASRQRLSGRYDIERLLSEITDSAIAMLMDVPGDPSIEIVAPVQDHGLWGARLLVEEADGVTPLAFMDEYAHLEATGSDSLVEALEELLRLIEKELD